MGHALEIRMAAPSAPTAGKAAELLRRTLRERTGTDTPVVSEGTARLTLDIRPGLGAEGYRIEGAPGAEILIAGNDARGLIYGVGRFLRESCYEEGRFLPGPWRGTSVPRLPVRAMYFASHFHNFYHDAPVDEVIRYVEDLALCGCNALSVWFDMHHYRGLDDPEAQAMVARLKTILAAANGVGIGAALTSIANEAYATTPEALRGDWTAGHDGYFKEPGGHYHVEICPNRPGGLELILKWREEMLDAFSGVNMEYFWIWPYDQGGCTCSRCAPWGVNGFLTTAEAVARLIRRRSPHTKIVLSTWYFDRFVHGEWQGLAERFARERPDWIDYLLIDDFGGFPDYPLRHGVPGGYPVVGFPEISMEGNHPWGGYGALPRPRHWEAYWGKAKPLLQGSWPYSEGIYEDLSKFMILQWEWAPDRTAGELIREYARGHFGPEAETDFARAACMMEEDEGASSWPAFTTGPLARAEECHGVMNALDRRLPERVRRSWRWRIHWLRAAIDAELKRTGAQRSEALEAHFDELTRIYHAAHAELYVRPPRRAAAR